MSEPLDIAIVGAGVAGAYCAYRLTQKGTRVALFESSDRIGGRLWSYHWPEADALTELGGEAFSPAHPHVTGLVVDELKLDVAPHPSFNSLNRLFLRNTLLQFTDFLSRVSFPKDGKTQPNDLVRYFVKDAYFIEKGPTKDDVADPFEAVATRLLGLMSPEVGQAFGALMQTFGAHIGALTQGKPLTADQLPKAVTPEIFGQMNALIAAIAEARVHLGEAAQALRGQSEAPARELDFWSVVVSELGQETYALFRAAGFVNTSALMFNFVELVDNLLLGAMIGVGQPNFWSIEGGYDQLPKTLIHKAQGAGLEVQMGWHLVALERDDKKGLTTLRFRDADGQVQHVTARKVISTVPVQCLDDHVTLDGFDNVLKQRFDAIRNGITTVPAGKLFLTYPEAWWQRMTDQPQGADSLYGYAATDMPPRAVYYKGHCGDGKRALMTGALTDAGNTDFWSSFLYPDAAIFPGATGDLAAPVHMVNACHEMIEEMHQGAMDSAIPQPELGLYHQWRDHGAGWSAWKPGRDIPHDAAILRCPFTDDRIDQGVCFCGDSVAERHGWVENIIESAEAMLDEAFGLPPAPWIPQ